MLSHEVIRNFQESLAYGLQHISEISAEASHALNLPAEKIRRYLTENIDYTLDQENLRGLQAYYEMAAELRLIDKFRPLSMATLETPECVGRASHSTHSD